MEHLVESAISHLEGRGYRIIENEGGYRVIHDHLGAPSQFDVDQLFCLAKINQWTE